ncbi:MAG: hypothetical protein V3T23_03140 [Nitrososphaerales archaeon]
MRKKALLAGAGSSFEGPWVNLESGEWLVEPSKDVRIVADNVEAFDHSDDPEDYGRKFKVVGPVRIHAIVSEDYDGDGVFLQINQISTGDST